ncbi:MAG: hypothetical protein ACK5MF_08105 [Vibrio sp.]|uniref:hypothetical protein n=1 Tax=Vibrio sp. TaxID=678 RepID=UPI003A8BC421
MSTSFEEQQAKRNLINDNGWRQGCVIEHDLVKGSQFVVCEVLQNEVKNKHQAKLIIISQDCDILSEEQNIECLLLKKSSKENKTIQNGLSPRKIQLNKPINDMFWETKADDVIIISKEFLMEHAHQADFVIPDKQLLNLKQWKANRYTRKGLPGVFVEKTRHVFCKPRDRDQPDDSLLNSDLFLKFSAYIASIRVYCEECCNGDIKCGFILLYKSRECRADGVDVDDIEEILNECLLDRLREIEGIELINDDKSESSLFNIFDLNDVMSDMEFPLGLVSEFPRYYFDSVSFSDDEDDDEMDED